MSADLPLQPSSAAPTTPAVLRDVVVRGLCRCGGEVVLLRTPGFDFCYFPGGHADPGETPADALVRELGEELGVVPLGPPQPCATIAWRYVRDDGVIVDETNIVFVVDLSDAPPVSREPPVTAFRADRATLLTLDIRPPALAALAVACLA